MGDSTDITTFKRIASHLEVSLSPVQMGQLQRYQEFLGSEAVAAGGIGPGEIDRLADRHIADSMMFLSGIAPEVMSLVDIGSGVGLPGIPIAICRPWLSVTLVDRSQRRTDLAGRAVRILGLENVEVVTEDALNVSGDYAMAVFRASFPIDQAARFVLDRPTIPEGIVGVSRLSDRPDIPSPPPGLAFELTEESKGMLDSPFWLLRMTSA